MLCGYSFVVTLGRCPGKGECVRGWVGEEADLDRTIEGLEMKAAICSVSRRCWPSDVISARSGMTGALFARVGPLMSRQEGAAAAGKERITGANC